MGECGAVLAEERLPGRSASECLLAVVRRVLAGRALTELEGIGVVVGPGSFTGVRVGLAVAKGLGEAGGLRMIAMSRLELVAGGDGVAVLDAGRGEFFCGVYRDGLRVSEALLRRDEVLPGARVTCEAKVEAALDRVRLVGEPGGLEMLAACEARAACGAWSDLATVDANYLRRTDAEIAVGQ